MVVLGDGISDARVTALIGEQHLTEVPAGKHTLKLWHETLGEQEKEIAVKPGEETRVEFVFKKK